MADWGELPLDIGITIVEKLSLYEYVFSFSRVCNSWGLAATLANNRRALSVQTPWLMLAEPQLPHTLKRRFYSFHDKRVRQLSLPAPTANDTRNAERGGSQNKLDENNLSRLYPPKEYNKESKWRYFSSCGWLICVTQIGLNVILIHPYSGKVIRTPTIPVTILQEKVKLKWHDRQYLHAFHKFALSECPLIAARGDYTLAMIMSTNVAFWRSTDDHWTVFVDEGYCRRYEEVYFYEEQLYAVRECGGHMEVVACGIPWTPKIKVVAEFNTDIKVSKYYLVGADGILLLVSRKLTNIFASKVGGKYMTKSFDVWEVNFKDTQLTQVSRLGNRAIFVGFNSAFFVNSDPYTPWLSFLYSTKPSEKLHYKRPTEHGVVSLNPDPIEYCKPNCIYYTDDLLGWYYLLEGGGRDMGVYCLTSGEKEEDFYKGTLQHSIDTPPLWVEVPRCLARSINIDCFGQPIKSSQN